MQRMFDSYIETANKPLLPETVEEFGEICFIISWKVPKIMVCCKVCNCLLHPVVTNYIFNYSL